MSDQIRHLRIFISSPGDVTDERTIATEVIEHFNFTPEFKGEFYLEALRWDDPRVSLPMSATETAQKSVDRYLIKPSECDIVVVVLWSRMGTPVNIDGRDYLSGTHYEFIEAVEAEVREALLERVSQTVAESEAQIIAGLAWYRLTIVRPELKEPS